MGFFNQAIIGDDYLARKRRPIKCKAPVINFICTRDYSERKSAVKDGTKKKPRQQAKQTSGGRRSSDLKVTSTVTKSAAKDNPKEKLCQQVKLSSSGKGASDQKVTSDKTRKSVAPKSTRVRAGKKRPTTNPEAAQHNEDHVEDHVPVAKRTRKVLNKKGRESLLHYLNSIDDVSLADAVTVRLSEVQLLSAKLKSFADTLCKSEQLLQDIASLPFL